MNLEKKKGYRLFFDKEAKKYDMLRGFYEIGYGGMRERKLLSLFCRGTSVINVACGTGRLLPFLAEMGFDVVGIDLSKGMLNVAKQKTAVNKKVHLVQCDAEFLPICNSAFDEIVCSRAFKLFPNPLETLKEWSRTLDEGGKVIVSLETSDPLWIRIGYKLKIPHMGNRFEWRYRTKNVQQLLDRAGFKICFAGCVIYFGRTIYEKVEKYFKPLMKLLELIDSHSKIGRNIMLVGSKRQSEQNRKNIKGLNETESTIAKLDCKVKDTPAFIHFFGADGTGKTTQAIMLSNRLKKIGIDNKLIRLRSGRTFASILYRFYKKLDSHTLVLGGDGRVLRITTINNAFGRQIWSLIEISSMIPLLILNVSVPIARGKTVVAERYMVDAIATIAYFVNDPSWIKSFWAKLLLRFIPQKSVLIYLDAPFVTIAQRKGSSVDPEDYIEFQRRIYAAFAKYTGAITIDTSALLEKQTHNLICRYLNV
jgi:ubiquinone/menaquinone biosynthesis C-methylase UbiE/thymidylate kinase